jgi:hypothetical protein
MNNMFQTNDEMAEIAESIMSGRPLKEDVIQNMTDFLNNYEAMKDVLGALQTYLKGYASKNASSKLMGNGNFTKAFNASKKVDMQLDKVNQDAKVFISLMRDVIQDS